MLQSMGSRRVRERMCSGKEKGCACLLYMQPVLRPQEQLLNKPTRQVAAKPSGFDNVIIICYLSGFLCVRNLGVVHLDGSGSRGVSHQFLASSPRLLVSWSLSRWLPPGDGKMESAVSWGSQLLPMCSCPQRSRNIR